MITLWPQHKQTEQGTAGAALMASRADATPEEQDRPCTGVPPCVGETIQAGSVFKAST